MKTIVIVFLVAAVVVLGLSVSSLRKALLSAQENTQFYEQRSEDLQRELMRVKSAYAQKEQFFNEIRQNIEALESKVDLKTLEKYVPQKTWSEIEPIVEKLKALRAPQ